MYGFGGWWPVESGCCSASRPSGRCGEELTDFQVACSQCRPRYKQCHRNQLNEARWYNREAHGNSIRNHGNSTRNHGNSTWTYREAFWIHKSTRAREGYRFRTFFCGSWQVGLVCLQQFEFDWQNWHVPFRIIQVLKLSWPSLRFYTFFFNVFF